MTVRSLYERYNSSREVRDASAAGEICVSRFEGIANIRRDFRLSSPCRQPCTRLGIP